MSFAARFKARRLELGKTQTQVAEEAGVSQQSIESIESGRTKKSRNLVQLARVLGCSPEWLLNGEDIIPLADINVRKVPILSYIQAGALTEASPISQFDGDMEYLITELDLSTAAFALRIRGDSMEPEFKEGDLVVIDPEVQPYPGEFVVAKNGSHEATFKKYRPLGIGPAGHTSFELVPLNPDHATLRTTETPLTIVGTMVEHRIYRRKR
ncbi:repressor [Serratia marcescens]|nr:repressor [Serratia marcescens]